MASNRNDAKEYLDFTSNGVSGSVTRGIVVSNEDPLFSGRVKVWIPVLHGGFDVGSTDSFILSGTITTDGTTTAYVKAGTIGALSTDAIASLPWAQVMGHNWGSIGQFAEEGVGKIQELNYGLFSTPRVGTEVMLIFENDNPDFPIVIGTVIHKNYYIWNNKLNLELTPGWRIAGDTVPDETPKTASDYPNEVANSFIIQSASGIKLQINDTLNRESFLIQAPITYRGANQLEDNSMASNRIKQTYPGFPTTASAPFVSTPTGSSTFAIDINSKTAQKYFSVSIFDPLPPPTPQPTANITPTDGSPPVFSLPPAIPSTQPINKAWPTPGGSTPPTQNQAFGAPGSGPGISLSVTPGSDVTAPIDGTVLALTTSDSGATIVMKGIDGTIQQFGPLANPLDLSKGLIGQKVKVGDKLGVCGKAGDSNAMLQWVIVPDPKNLVQGGKEATDLLAASAKGKGASFKGSLAPPSISPIDWNTSVNSITSLSGTQLGNLLAANSIQNEFNALPANEHYRNMGLEMSTVVGRETIFLRHPSGGFVGFDADGNFMVHTTGDANFKVGRSANWSIFGAFLVDCLTMWHKVAMVYRIFAMTFTHAKHIKDEEAANANIPDFFKRNVLFKEADMADAVEASKSNTWIIDNSTGQVMGNIDSVSKGNSTNFTPQSNTSSPPSSAANKGKSSAGPNLNKLIKAEDEARANPNFQPGNGVTHCNSATAYVASAMGAPMGPLSTSSNNPSFPGINANTQCNNLSKSSAYKAVSEAMAQDLANQGILVISSWYNNSAGGHGHVAPVRPLNVPGDPKEIGGSGALISNVGGHVNIVKRSGAYPKGSTVIYYTPS